MKKYILGLISGILATTILFSSAPALAQSLNADFNAINIKQNGKKVASVGDGYTLSNGTVVPFSISYNGTTYLPMRKLSELLGLKVNWDEKTNTASLNSVDYIEPNQGDPKSIKYVSNNPVFEVNSNLYDKSTYPSIYVNTDENNELYIREGPFFDNLDFYIAVINGEYKITESKNPYVKGTLATSFNKKYVKVTSELVYLSAGKTAYDSRVEYNGKVIVSPSSPYYNSSTDNIGIRKIFGYGGVSPNGWWFNLNDMLKYLGLANTTTYDATTNIIKIN